MYFFQILAVTMCIGGIVLMAYAEGFEGPNAVGVTLSAGAAVGAALYKVSTQTYYFPPPLEKKTIRKHHTEIGWYGPCCLRQGYRESQV